MVKQRMTLALVMGIAAVMFLVVPDAQAQKTKGKTRAAATKYLMRGITQAHCKGVGDLLKDAGPADDKAWDNLACHASCLNEVSYLLMDDGRCPDGTWAGAAKTLREASEAVIKAAEAKDAAAAKTAFGNLTKSCGACHSAHKG